MFFQKGSTHILLLFIMLIGIVVSVYLVLHPTFFKPKASIDETRIEFVDANGDVIAAADNKIVKIKLTYVATASADATASAYATTLYPTNFRVASSSSELNLADKQTFDSNGKIIDWNLSDTSGEKTVYAQFQVNDIWETEVSTSINLVLPTSSPTPSPTASPSPVATSRPSATATPIVTASPSPTPTTSAIPSVTPIVQTPEPIQSRDTSELLRRTAPPSVVPFPTTAPIIDNIASASNIPIVGGVINFFVNILSQIFK